MKILFCDNSLRELLNFRGDIVDFFARKGCDIVLVSPQTREYEPDLPNIRYISVSMDRSGTNPLAEISYFITLCRIYRTEKPDVVFHYTIKPNIYGTLAAHFSGCKSIAMVAGLGYMFTGNSISKRLGRLLYKFGLRCSQQVLLLNSANAESLVSKGFIRAERAILLAGGEGVNLTRFHYNESRFDTVRYLMVARVLYDKGYEEYVDAAALVKQKYPDIEIGLLGPLDETSPMRVPKTIVDKDVAAGKIAYFGVTDDVRSWCSRGGVVIVLPSYHEGMNRSLMEACAMGCPCITTDIPGCREIVDDGVNGYLVPKKDSASLAAAMIRFIELPLKEKEAMAAKSRKIAEERFDMNKVIETYERLISDISIRKV